MTLRLDPITVIVAVLAALAIGYGGGRIHGDAIHQKLPPKTQIINNTQYQTTENKNIQSSEQAQITVVTARTNVNINISARTNFSFSSRTNKFSKTNISK